MVIPALSVPPDEQGYPMEYFVRAMDRWEGTLFEEGSAKTPLQFQVDPMDASGGAVTSQWWFWAAAGAAVLGGAALVFVATQQGSDTVTLTIRNGGVQGGQ